MSRDEQAITEAALEAFWAEVAARVPEAVAGDMDPAVAEHFERVAAAIVRRWIACNVPGGR